MKSKTRRPVLNACYLNSIIISLSVRSNVICIDTNLLIISLRNRNMSYTKSDQISRTGCTTIKISHMLFQSQLGLWEWRLLPAFNHLSAPLNLFRLSLCTLDFLNWRDIVSYYWTQLLNQTFLLVLKVFKTYPIKINFIYNLLYIITFWSLCSLVKLVSIHLNTAKKVCNNFYPLNTMSVMYY